MWGGCVWLAIGMGMGIWGEYRNIEEEEEEGDAIGWDGDGDGKEVLDCQLHKLCGDLLY